MNLVKYFTEVLFPKPKYLTPERKRDIANRFLARSSSLDGVCSDSQVSFSASRTEGLIRSGRYITQEDMSKMREKALSYRL